MERLTKSRDADYFQTDPNQWTEEDRKESLRRAMRWPQETSETRRMSTPKLVTDRNYQKKQQKRVEVRKRIHWEKVLAFPAHHSDVRQKEISAKLGLNLFNEAQQMGLANTQFGLSKPRHDAFLEKKEKEYEVKKKKKAWRRVLRGPSWDAAAKFEKLSKVSCNGDLRPAFEKFQAEREQARQEEDMRRERWQRTLQGPTSSEQLACIERLSQPRPSSAPAGGSRRSETRRIPYGGAFDCEQMMTHEFGNSMTHCLGSPRGRWAISPRWVVSPRGGGGGLEDGASRDHQCRPGLMPVRPTFEGATRHFTPIMDACRPQGRNSMHKQPGDQYGFDMYIPC